MSALDGDNVVNTSDNMPWYQGKTMMQTLETVEIASDHNFINPRFPVQYVNRPHLDFRGFCGTIAAGIFHQGDEITVLPSGKKSTIKSIIAYEGELTQAFPPMAVTFTLNDEIDISRGDLIIAGNDLPLIADSFNATIVWMAEKSMIPGRQYSIKLATRSVSGSISIIHHRIDVNTLAYHDANELKLNEIGYCSVSVNAPLVFDAYQLSKGTGSFIVIDRLTNVTVGAGMISGITNDSDLTPVTFAERAARFSQIATIIGLTGENAEIMAYQLERRLFDNGHAVSVLEQFTPLMSSIIKNAGLIGLVINADAGVDIHFDSNQQSLEAIYQQLKQKKVIY
jgi:bifunctional enzyme CysN/CysC